MEFLAPQIYQIAQLEQEWQKLLQYWKESKH